MLTTPEPSLSFIRFGFFTPVERGPYCRQVGLRLLRNEEKTNDITNPVDAHKKRTT